jgi:general secretion pathway protein H
MSRFSSTGLESDAEGGFTLIELLVVLAIMGAIGAMVAVNMRFTAPGYDARVAAQMIASALRSARSDAIVSGNPVALTIDLVRRELKMGLHPIRKIPASVSLRFRVAREEVVNESVGKISFRQDGRSSGGSILVGGGGHNWLIRVDWLTGRVSVGEAAQNEQS